MSEYSRESVLSLAIHLFPELFHDAMVVLCLSLNVECLRLPYFELIYPGVILFSFLESVVVAFPYLVQLSDALKFDFFFFESSSDLRDFPSYHFYC